MGVSLGVILAATPSVAQSIPSTADPSRIFSSPTLKAPDFESVGGSSSRPLSLANPPAGAENIKFTLRRVEIEGATAYSEDELKSIYAPMMGREISLADLFILSAQIQQKYFTDGYSFARVVLPEQKVDDGSVTLEIIEGGVAEVDAQNLNANSYLVQDAVSQIAAMRPLNVLKLERLLLVLNDFVDGDVVSVVSGLDTNDPRRSNGLIKISLVQQEKKPLSGYARINNHGSVFSGPVQIEAGLSYIHAPINYSKTSISMAAAIPFNDMKNVGVQVRTPIFGASGASLNASYTRGWSEAGHTLDVLDIIGQNETFSAGVNYPIMRQRDIDWNTFANLTLKNVDSDFLGIDLYRDRLRSVSVGTNITKSDGLSGVNFAGVTFTHGFDVFGARETGSSELSRLEGRSDFFKTEGQFGRLQSLPRGFEFYGNAAFQWANTPLLSSEEFGYGGAERGRAFSPSELTGDRGASVTVEIRKNFRPEAFNLALQPFVTYEAGMVKNLDSTDRSSQSGTSVGAGVRVYAPNGISGEFLVSKPLTRNLENPPRYASEDGLQMLFSLQKSF
jgi:hemolysin activation/secretion protein